MYLHPSIPALQITQLEKVCYYLSQIPHIRFPSKNCVSPNDSKNGTAVRLDLKFHPIDNFNVDYDDLISTSTMTTSLRCLLRQSCPIIDLRKTIFKPRTSEGLSVSPSWAKRCDPLIAYQTALARYPVGLYQAAPLGSSHFSRKTALARLNSNEADDTLRQDDTNPDVVDCLHISLFCE